MIEFKPSSHFLLLRPVEAPSQQTVIRSSATDARAFLVADAGPGSYTDAGVLVPTRIAKGSVVLVDPKHTVELWWGSSHYRVVAEKFVFGVLEGPEMEALIK